MYRTQCPECKIDETPRTDKYGWWHIKHKKPPTFKIVETCNENGRVQVGNFNDQYVFDDMHLDKAPDEPYYPTHWRVIQKPEVYENT